MKKTQMKMEILNYKETPYESLSLYRDYYNEDPNLFVWKHGVALVKSLNNEYALVRFENLCRPITDAASLDEAEKLIMQEYACDRYYIDHMEKIWWAGEWDTSHAYSAVESMALGIIKGLKKKGLSIQNGQKNFVSGIDVIQLKRGPLIDDLGIEGNPISHTHIALIKDWNSNELKLLKLDFIKVLNKEIAVQLLTEYRAKMVEMDCDASHRQVTRYRVLSYKTEILEEFIAQHA